MNSGDSVHDDSGLVCFVHAALGILAQPHGSRPAIVSGSFFEQPPLCAATYIRAGAAISLRSSDSDLLETESEELEGDDLFEGRQVPLGIDAIPGSVRAGFQQSEAFVVVERAGVTPVSSANSPTL